MRQLRQRRPPPLCPACTRRPCHGGGRQPAAHCIQTQSLARLQCFPRFLLTNLLTCDQGISLEYLKWLQLTFGHLLGRMTTSQFEKIFLRPRTALRSCSVACELAADDATTRHVGQATWFISHTWSNPFQDTLEAILNFFDGSVGIEGAPSAFMWFDVFVDSQHETAASVTKTPSWYMTTFKSSIHSIGNLLLVVDAWSDPTALKRAWCVAAAPAPAAPAPAAPATPAAFYTRCAVSDCDVAGACLSCTPSPAKNKKKIAEDLQLR